MLQNANSEPVTIFREAFSNEFEIHAVNGKPSFALIAHINKAQLIKIKSDIEQLLVEIEKREEEARLEDDGSYVDDLFEDRSHKSSKDHYNDDLDMDQQSQQFWDNV